MSSLAVVGTGLVGASVGLAARGAGIDVVLRDASPEHARRAADLGAGRPPAPDEPPADLVVLAVPPERVAGVLRDAQRAGLGRTYTDVASVKAAVAGEALRLGCDLATYVGGHPMAGRERSGPGAARGDLFVGRPWVLTRGDAGDEHVRRVRALVTACGAVPVEAGAEEHDEAVALVSHVPQVVSSLLAGRLVDAPAAAVALAGQGLRDTTRVAGSDPALWTAILAANARPVRAVLEALRADLDRLLGALGHDDDGVRDALARGVEGRARIPGKHGGTPTTYAAVPVVLRDRPGELARVFLEAALAGVNVEDIAMEHSPGQPVGLVELLVRPEAAGRLADALAAHGWVVHR
ncbi:prephenate dehydrogenase [Vallicoccus soli]|uniref:Prephenate dehydrogenase n=1 Tax=Vallicoccus soli TaxID=2339232 RepID=A0A3A3YPN8_9ACTN|nr:prephenate dehydrogenase [Vallicoccus soli]